MTAIAQTLEALLSPQDEGQFLRESLGRATLRVEGNADKFAQVLSWSELNSFLSRGGGNLSRVNVTSGGERLTDTLYSRIGVSGTPHVQAGELGALLLQGAVIHVEAAEEVFNSVSAICDSVGSRLETAVRASIWASWREPKVPYSLWNDHDVIVLQISGRALWRVHKPGPLFPTEAGAPKGSDLREAPGSQELTLEQGHLLYLPRGWWYCELSLNQPALVLGLSFRSPTGIDILGRLVDQLSLVEVMRMDCPRFADAATQCRYLTWIQQELLRACTEPGLLDGFLKDMRAMADPERTLGLPWSALDDAGVLSPDLVAMSLVRFPESVVNSLNSNAYEVFFDGRTIALDDQTGAILKRLTGCRGMSIRDLLEAFGGEPARTRILSAVSQLLADGLIVCQEFVAHGEDRGPAHGSRYSGEVRVLESGVQEEQL